MAELISRAAAKFQACNWSVKPNAVIFDGIKEAIKSQLDMAPAVDAVPVEWLEWRIMNAKYNGIKEAADAFEFVLKCWKEQEARYPERRS